MSKNLAGAKAVVTGGTHGMGLAIVKALLTAGAEVVVTGRNEKTLEDARTELAGQAAHVVRSDAASMADIAALAEFVGHKLGRIDHVFVNHGVAAFAELAEVTEEDWDRHFTINTKGAFFTVQALAPLLADGGSIVFTTVGNDVIFPGLSAYSASKEAVRAFAHVLAAELVPRKIRVNSVAPGFIETPTMGVPGLSARERAEFVQQGYDSTPLRRTGTVEEVAAAALFLAADATFTTNVELAVDGGFAQGLPVAH
ncbi:SDR family oxidoreductase [Nocardia cyriacigeorgica]|uniref:SDR family oxidoreductase n=1 Tax=Nocardia cyriacigeorgica TaxID=135487 RepID=A0A6P1DCU8_9NOCA|nr:SDR family oxidoreductase [Nocardia cyriacigeorgica]NEW41913.1 SDR family oxidoreductase [Nocardia cyriacigeorgica]NEW46433.1 SDR family oxidoreductase [Nocardia cyriacigeorgica]NEW53057.1 SDR family oxidoreductase [Nocardia cyriacigeorgica]NEW57047.1 SDR family oxidoreductase [Nocardia cyriacigeorgica]